MAVGFLIFCACNQFTRMQFNTGVRHVVPVVPFVFLIAAGALARIPRSAAIAFGVTATSWSLCLAMERDVELHGGIVGCIGAVFRDGPRLPWLKTVELMHIALPGGTVASSLLVIGLAALLIWIVWRPQIKALRQMKP
jgi:hypothetical protein